MPYPDLKVFLTDPKHQKEKEFLHGVLDDYFQGKAEEAKKKRESEGGPVNLFDALFGGEKNDG